MAALGGLGNVCARMLVRGTGVIHVVTLLVVYKQYCISQLTANKSQKWKFNSDSIGTLKTLGWLIMLQSQGFSDYMLNCRISLNHVAHQIKNIKQLCRSLEIPICSWSYHWRSQNSQWINKHPLQVQVYRMNKLIIQYLW